jgi:hypothetical protein
MYTIMQRFRNKNRKKHPNWGPWRLSSGIWKAHELPHLIENSTDNFNREERYLEKELIIFELVPVVSLLQPDTDDPFKEDMPT